MLLTLSLGWQEKCLLQMSSIFYPCGTQDLNNRDKDKLIKNYILTTTAVNECSAEWNHTQKIGLRSLHCTSGLVRELVQSHTHLGKGFYIQRRVRGGWRKMAPFYSLSLTECSYIFTGPQSLILYMTDLHLIVQNIQLKRKISTWLSLNTTVGYCAAGL